MGTVRKLPDAVSNRIAAGEVVERPASAVKELVENAIDARAGSIEIHVLDGGAGMIRILDDGEGMEPDDAALALQRHATSKLVTADDLEAIRTLGFRGEALPSIASVSRFTLRTRTSEAPEGVEIRLEGGAVVDRTAAGMPPGTQVEVRDLFYNAPARRKFMRSQAGENREIARCVAEYAFAYEDLAFCLEMETKERFRFGRGLPLEERIKIVHGANVARSLLRVEAERDGLTLRGFVAGPDQAKGQGRYGLLVMNGRPIRDAALSKAVMEGYGSLLQRRRFPVYVLHLDLAPDRVDVNVHPSKSEVRFRDGGMLFRFVKEGVRSALTPTSISRPVRSAPPAMEFGGADRVREPAPAVPWEETVSSEPAQAVASIAAPASAPCTVRGQVGKTYIVCEDAEGLILVDQHAAHERIIYDRLQEGIQGGAVERQDLLIPHVLDLPWGDGELPEELIDHFHRLGFEVDAFGPGQIAVRSVPAFGGEAMTSDAVLEMIETYQEGRTMPENERLDQVAAVVSCRSAIMAGEELTVQEMEGLIGQLNQGLKGTTCPHGRPVAMRMTFAELEKLFGRR